MHRPSLKHHEASDDLREWPSALTAATAAEPIAALRPRSGITTTGRRGRQDR